MKRISGESWNATKIGAHVVYTRLANRAGLHDANGAGRFLQTMPINGCLPWHPPSLNHPMGRDWSQSPRELHWAQLTKKQKTNWKLFRWRLFWICAHPTVPTHPHGYQSHGCITVEYSRRITAPETTWAARFSRTHNFPRTTTPSQVAKHPSSTSYVVSGNYSRDGNSSSTGSFAHAWMKKREQSGGESCHWVSKLCHAT